MLKTDDEALLWLQVPLHYAFYFWWPETQRALTQFSVTITFVSSLLIQNFETKNAWWGTILAYKSFNLKILC